MNQIAQRQAYFIIREHQGLSWSECSPLKAVGSHDSGELFEQQVKLSSGLVVRRVVVKLHHPTRHGDEQVAILTNLPTVIDALTIANLYLRRWRIENMFQTITDTFYCELETLGYPRAALFVFLWH